MPSVSAKPSAKSSRSAGVASITACEMPLNTSATGTSSASQSGRAWCHAAAQRTTSARLTPGGSSGASSGFTGPPRRPLRLGQQLELLRG